MTPILHVLLTEPVKHFPSVQVSKVFSLPIRHLADPAHQRYTCFRPWLVRMPVFVGRPHRIWGLTAVMMDLTLAHLLPNYTSISSVGVK